jgi:nucleotide-binding universal stress UspA family protein
MTDLFDRVVVPVADPNDAAATCRALKEYDVGSVLAIHVVEKAGGAPGETSVEQREEYAGEIFTVVEAVLGEVVDLETELTFDTDVADAIFDAAREYDATAIVFTPRGGSRWVRLLTGDVALSLVTETDRPVVVLADSEAVDPDEVVADSTDSDAPGSD